MKQFKIRNPQGLFSRGGNRPRFNKIGKTWTSEKALKLHLNQLAGRYSGKDPYIGCTLVEFEFKEVGTSTMDMNSFITALAAKKAIAAQKRAEAYEKAELKRLEAAVVEQKKKLGIVP